MTVWGRCWARWRPTDWRDDTVVVYTSDHGEMAGEHGMWCKHAFFEGAVRVPMLLAWPGHVAAGRRIGQVTSLIDLVRTILDMAGDDTRRPGRRELA